MPRQVGQLTNHVTLYSDYVDPQNPNLMSSLISEVVATPPLNIELVGSRVRLAWPAIAGDYVLQVTESLDSSASWILDGNPVVEVGQQRTVTVKVTNGQRFYRLVRP